MIKITREDLEAFFKVSNIMIRKDIEIKAPTTYDELNAIISEDTNTIMSMMIDRFDTTNRKPVASTTTSNSTPVKTAKVNDDTASDIIPSTSDTTVSSKDKKALDEINATVAELEAKASSGTTIK